MKPIDWELFKIQALRAAGLEGHPQAGELYAWAWYRVGAYGKDEVLEHLCGLAEIVLEEV